MQPQAAKGIATTRDSAKSAVKSRPPHSIRWSYTITSWLGLVPFLLFCLLFELLPAVVIIQSSFIDSNTRAVTLNNYQRAFFDPKNLSNLHAFQSSISISLATALLGTIFGLLAAYGVY